MTLTAKDKEIDDLKLQLTLQEKKLKDGEYLVLHASKALRKNKKNGLGLLVLCAGFLITWFLFYTIIASMKWI